jgi:asparagine N-glycosylation enzyme membrane subunit Stt3
MSEDLGALLVLPERFQNWAGQLCLLGLPTDYRTLVCTLSAAIAIVLMYVIWNQKWNPQKKTAGLCFGATLTLAALASPYLFIYDMSILFPVLVFCMEFLLGEEKWGLGSHYLLTLLLLSPLIWFTSLSIVQVVPIQGSVLWMSVPLYLLTRMIAKSERFKVQQVDQSLI